MQSFRYRLIASSAVIVLMATGCATNSSTVTTNVNTATVNTNTVNPAGETTLSGSADANVNDTPTATADDDTTVNTTKTFDVVASQFSFSPSTVTVNQGDTVVINLTTEDVPHGFSLPDFDINETITPGKTTTVEFVADQTGSFSFSCSVACGAGHSSMRGTLVVN